MVKRIFEKENIIVISRFWFAGIVIIGLALFLSFRLWYLQVLRGDYYQKVATNNHLSKIFVPAARGQIYDRKGKLILGNRAFYDLVFIQQHAKDSAQTFLKLEEILGMPAKSLQKRLELGRTGRAYTPIPLKRNLSLHQVSMVNANINELPGVYIQTTPRRDYKPWSPPHLVGYLGEVNPAKLKAQTDLINPYALGDLVGKQGLEKQWEEYLRGKRGYRIVQVDAHGRSDEAADIKMDLPSVPAENGNDLILNLDLELQQAVRQAFQGRNGAVIVMDPRSGAILATASEPTFDTSLFQDSISWERWQSLSHHPFTPLLDKTTGGEFPPGSLYKSIVAIAGLEEKVISTESTSYCPGHFSLGGEVFHCHKRTGHGRVNLKQAIAQSCDVYFYELGNKLGVDRIAKYAEAFFLGRKLGVDINTERPGLIPTNKWHQDRFKHRMRGGETNNIAIGQGFNLMTPIQMLSMYATIANGGSVWQPYVVSKVINQMGETVFEKKPTLLHKVDIVEKETFDIIRDALKSVVHDKEGSGSRARLKNVTVAGKTGTAQVVSLSKLADWTNASMKWKEHAIFVAFAPAENAEVAVLVFSQNDPTGGGSGAAAPVAQQILASYFRIKDKEMATKSSSAAEDKNVLRR